MSNILSDYVTPKQLAAEFGVSQRTIARWQNLPDALPRTTIGGRTFYNVASVRDWMKAQEANPRPRNSRGEAA